VITVDCYQYENPAIWKYDAWYRIVGGGPAALNGMYIQSDSSGNTLGLPNC
jgi:hypothetical protein